MNLIVIQQSIKALLSELKSNCRKLHMTLYFEIIYINIIMIIFLTSPLI